MEWIILAVAVVVVGGVVLKIAASIAGAVAAIVIVVVALVGLGVIHPSGLFDQQAKDVRKSIKHELQQLGCGEGGGVTIGNTDRCDDYQKARAACAHRPEAGRGACRRRVDRRFHAELRDRRPGKDDGNLDKDDGKPNKRQRKANKRTAGERDRG